MPALLALLLGLFFFLMNIIPTAHLDVLWRWVFDVPLPIWIGGMGMTSGLVLLVAGYGIAQLSPMQLLSRTIQVAILPVLLLTCINIEFPFNLRQFFDLTPVAQRLRGLQDSGQPLAEERNALTLRGQVRFRRRARFEQRVGQVAANLRCEALSQRLGLLGKGEVQALASDRTALIGLVVMSSEARGSFRLLDQDFSIEQYALMLPRGDYDFRLAVNRQLARVYRSGEIEKIYARWLGPLGPPSVLLSATYYIQSLAE